MLFQRIRDELGEIVETVYFEDKSFQEQISFFNAHNVIISPHGAQLCSIPFAPKNSVIIECCHTDWHPYYYFPGLSISSSKTHVMICDDHSVFPAGRSSYIKNEMKLNIHVDPDKVVAAVQSYARGGLDSQKVHLM